MHKTGSGKAAQVSPWKGLVSVDEKTNHPRRMGREGHNAGKSTLDGHHQCGTEVHLDSE